MKLGFATKQYIEKTKIYLAFIFFARIYITVYCKCILVFLQNIWKNNSTRKKNNNRNTFFKLWLQWLLVKGNYRSRWGGLCWDVLFAMTEHVVCIWLHIPYTSLFQISDTKWTAVTLLHHWYYHHFPPQPPFPHQHSNLHSNCNSLQPCFCGTAITIMNSHSWQRLQIVNMIQNCIK